MQYFFDSLSGITNRSIPCQPWRGCPRKQIRRGHLLPLRPDRGSINKEKSRKSVSKRGKDSKRSPNVPRNRIPSNAPISSIGGPFSRRFSCFRWAYTWKRVRDSFDSTERNATALRLQGYVRLVAGKEEGREGGERKKKNVIIIKKRRNKERGRGEERENGAYARFLEHGRKGWPLLRISQGRNRWPPAVGARRGTSGCPYVELSSQEVPNHLSLPSLLASPRTQRTMIAGVSSFLSARATTSRCQRCPTVRFADLLSSLFARFASHLVA